MKTKKKHKKKKKKNNNNKNKNNNSIKNKNNNNKKNKKSTADRSATAKEAAKRPQAIVKDCVPVFAAHLRAKHSACSAAHREHALAFGLLSRLLLRQQVREAAVDELWHEAVGLLRAAKRVKPNRRRRLQKSHTPPTHPASI